MKKISLLAFLALVACGGAEPNIKIQTADPDAPAQDPKMASQYDPNGQGSADADENQAEMNAEDAAETGEPIIASTPFNMDEQENWAAEGGDSPYSYSPDDSTQFEINTNIDGDSYVQQPMVPMSNNPPPAPAPEPAPQPQPAPADVAPQAQPAAEPTPAPAPEPAPVQNQASAPAQPQPKDSAPTKKLASEAEETKDTAFGAVGSYKIGNPYLIDGVVYYPHEDYEYSEVGVASWYGPQFAGSKTSNGEVFDETRFTAAHRTLPMPTLVRVTNMENGNSMNVKVNDRGPFARDRIIDLSSAAADALGIKDKGSARVKIDILKDQSLKLKELAMQSKNTDIYEADKFFADANKAAPAPTSAPEKQQPAAAPEPKVAPAPEAKPAPTPAPKPAPAPTPAPAADNTGAIDESNATIDTKVYFAPESGDYYVQVAAYSSYDRAEGLKDKIDSIGDVKIYKALQGGKTLYKVRLGAFATKTRAKDALAGVEAKGVSGARIILKEGNNFRWNVK